jgi:hypothetical protein
MSDLYYIQDKRQYVGNCLLWWGKDRRGYTCDIDRAGVYTREEAFGQNSSRETDIPWPKEYIDKRLSRMADAQRLDIKDALGKDHDKLYKPVYEVPSVEKCYHCGKFISLNYIKNNGYTCPHCDGDNWP